MYNKWSKELRHQVDWLIENKWINESREILRNKNIII